MKSKPKTMKPLSEEDTRAFFKCPRGHSLPKRTARGRCTTDECCIAANGAHGAVKEAVAATVQTAMEVNAFAEETERLLDARGRMTAWDQQHPLPKLPPTRALKPGESMFTFLRERAMQAAPLALERIVRKALLMPGAAGDAAADNILDRVGFTRKGDAPIEFNGPVQIINMDPSRVPLLRQKADVVEGELVENTQTEVVHGAGSAVPGEAEGADSLDDGEGDDGT